MKMKERLMLHLVNVLVVPFYTIFVEKRMISVLIKNCYKNALKGSRTVLMCRIKSSVGVSHLADHL